MADKLSQHFRRVVPSIIEVPLEVNRYNYLGVTLMSDLTWSDHIRNITAMSRRLVGLLYRQFYMWS